MTIGDLVRNEIFSKVADEHPNEIERIDQSHWQPFYKKFQQGSQNHFEKYFFPYGLITDPNLRKSEVYASLKKAWQSTKDPVQIIEELGTYQDAFIDIVCGTNFQEQSKIIAKHIHNFTVFGAPTSTYPFLMQLSKSLSDELFPEDEGAAILDVVESFLIRRAICGHEPTGLHAVFKRLWTDCGPHPNKDSVNDRIRAHKTVVWPDSESVSKAISQRPLGPAIIRYLLVEYDRSLGGDQPRDVPWIEHVLPVKPVDQWYEYFTREQHERLLGLFANLIPLSQEMNIGLSNGPYSSKRESYEKDSMFKSARKFAQEYSSWTPDTLEARGFELAKWAVARWSY
jgi:hypothetical protein